MTGFPARLFMGLALASCASCALAAGFAINAVPPAQSRPAVAAKAAPAMLLDDSVPARRVVLAAPADAEIAALRRTNASAKAASGALSRPNGSKGQPLAIGIGRAVPASARQVALDGLDWKAAADGSRAARVEVQSPGAQGLRVALSLSRDVPGMSVRFAGANGQVFGPVSAADIRSDAQQFGNYWSPLVDGETIKVEFAVPAGTSLAGAQANMPLVSHSLVPTNELNHISVKRLVDIGTSLPCEIDVKCVSPTAALTNAASAVASITFSKPTGGLFLCSGQVLNDSVSDNVPYFFTANHCIDSAAAAATIQSYWFFEATACGSNVVRPDYVVLSGGAKLLARSADWDWSLSRLNTFPPAGVVFSAWRAEPVAAGTPLTVLHHPNGDLKKISQGNAASYVPDPLYTGTTPATFLYMTYTQGQTEGGSSGSGVLTFNAAGNFYEVRGGLYVGLDGACPVPAGYYDVYSRIDNMVPNVREYLTPGNNPAGTVSVVEFYNAGLDHYFMSSNPSEINDLDTGVHPGWSRTGLRFNAYATPVAGTNPVCRFYRAPAFGDSHFYSASPAECAATAAAHPVDWIYESAAVFYIALPDPNTGACPANTNPLWRFFNTVRTNHRYTGDVMTRDDLRADPFTWIAEGYGPDAVIMCSPAGS